MCMEHRRWKKVGEGGDRERAEQSKEWREWGVGHLGFDRSANLWYRVPSGMEVKPEGRARTHARLTICLQFDGEGEGEQIQVCSWERRRYRLYVCVCVCGSISFPYADAEQEAYVDTK